MGAEITGDQGLGEHSGALGTRAPTAETAEHERQFVYDSIFTGRQDV